MDKEELIELFDRYLNEIGKYYSFQEWIEKQGYSMSELGFKEE
jgi:hypothetical protein